MINTNVHSDSITVTYTVRDRGQDYEEYRYDWVTEGGSESDSFFATIEDAIQDAETFYQ